MDNLNTDNDIIEQELGNEEVIMDMPFDPNKTRVHTQTMNVGQIVDMLENDEIMLDSERSNLWDSVRKSRLIESLLLRLPIPNFYFDEQDDNKWLVIDGLQRINTFKSFIKDKMPLKGLEFFKVLEQKTYEELPRELQRRIKWSELSVIILEKGTPDAVKFLLFSRINQSGLSLKPQEIRNTMYQGKATNLINELVDKNNEIGQSFIKATNNKISTERMQDRDFAARFVAFYILSYENYKPNLDSFLNIGMTTITQLSSLNIEKLKSDFKKAMETAYVIFGNDAFRKPINLVSRIKPINKALFEVLSVSFAKCSAIELEILIKNKEVFKEEFIQLNHSERFERSISQGTALKENVELRFKSIQNLIQKILEHA